MLTTNETLQKKESKFTSEIDAVITQMEVALESIYAPEGHFMRLVFIDERPAFPKVKEWIVKLNNHAELHLVGHSYSYQEITEKTDIKGLEVTKH